MDPVTTTPLVETKLFGPRARQRLVPRPRLDLRGRTGDAKLTLVSAPAGFGKTTLLVVLARGRPRRRRRGSSLDEPERRSARLLDLRA